MPKPMRNGPISACQPRQNGNSRRVADFPESPSFGETSSGLKVSGWRTLTRGIFPTRTQALMVSLASLRWSSTRPTDTVYTTWLEMSGSGLRTGIDRIIMHNLPRQVALRATRRARMLPLIRRNRKRRKKPIVEVRSFARTSTARAIWWEREARARLVREQITWASAVSQPQLPPQQRVLLSRKNWLSIKRVGEL